MRSTRNTVGGVFAAITAGISLVMAIWDVVSWIMTMSLGNIFAGRPFLSFFVALFQESIFDFGDTQMHLLFAGTMLFFVIGACVNFLAAIVLLKRGSNHKGASITLGIINEVGIIFWIIFSGRAGFYVGKYIIGNSHIYLRWYILESVVIISLVCSFLAAAFLQLISTILFKNATDNFVTGQAAMPLPVPTPVQQPFPIQTPPQPSPVPQPVQTPVPQAVPTPQPASAPVLTPQKNPIPAQQQVKEKMGNVCVLKGEVRGKRDYVIPKNCKIILGKNPNKANIVFRNPHVSNIHCSISYNAQTNRYIVKDHSSNGTFIANKRLQKEVQTECPAGTVLYLADSNTSVILK